MLEQSLPINCTIGSLAELCRSWRVDCADLSEMTVPASTVIYDVLTAIGMPFNAIRQVLTVSELAAIGVWQDHTVPAALCQRCGDEAQHLVHARGGGWLLVCDTCKSKIKHD